MNKTLLEQFLKEECTPYVRELVKSGLEDSASGAGPRTRRYEFNRFEIAFDFDEGNVTIEDVLDASEAGAQRVSITEFLAALSRGPA